MLYRPAPATVLAVLIAGLLLIALALGGAPGELIITVASLALGALAVLVALVVFRRDRARFQEELRREAVATALAEERLAITRDLHDIVSNGLGLVTVRAGTAVAVPRVEVTDLHDALTDIERISRSTTVELRRMLVHLRGEPAPLSPAPDLARISELVDNARRGGLTVTLDSTAPEPHTQGVAVTAYRIVQEALGNAARHAGPTLVHVVLQREDEALLVEIVDSGPVPGWASGRSQGFGLVGLRERVSALGGTMESGRRGRGFFVRAVLPDPRGES